MSSPEHIQKAKRGIDVVSFVMVPVQVLGIGVTAVCLRKFTPLPTWAALVLAFPVFLAPFWGGLWLLSRRK